MSTVSCAITTASGGSGLSQVVVWACWSRTACEVIRRLPNRAPSASSVLFSACGSGRFRLLVVATATKFLPASGDRDKGYIRGQDIRSNKQERINDDHCRRQGAAAACPFPFFGDADRAAMDRPQRPPQHGLLQRDVRPRHR